MFDTHCHMHSSDYPLPAGEELAAANKAGVNDILCVGTDVKDSKKAIEFSLTHQGVWASIGIHPHEAGGPDTISELEQLLTDESTSKVKAVGECGLDYYYSLNSRTAQIRLFEQHLDLANRYDLPLTLHIRDKAADNSAAVKEAIEIIDNFPGIRAVVHSFTSGQNDLKSVLSRGLYVGVNGIVTFHGSKEMEAMYLSIPLEQMMLETDAPYLTPKPKRGKVNSSKYMRYTADYLAGLRGVDTDEIIRITSQNAKNLFLNSSK